jgi:hypothetical protein
MKPVIGLGRLCPFSPTCEENKPCQRCTYIGRTEDDKAVFTPAQEKEIEDFLRKRSDLMNYLAKLEELDSPPPPADGEFIGNNKVDN